MHTDAYDFIPFLLTKCEAGGQVDNSGMEIPDNEFFAVLQTKFQMENLLKYFLLVLLWTCFTDYCLQVSLLCHLH